jgi:hypothetical protein
MRREPGRGYDSFVVRLWHEASTGNLLRAEVEHVQSGSVDVRPGGSLDWIRDWLRARVNRQAKEEGESK